MKFNNIMKRIGAKLLVCTVVSATVLSGCSSENKKEDTTTTEAENLKYDEEAITAIRNGLTKLESYDQSYIISTQLDEPSSNSEFLTVVDGDVNYTEYSVDEEGNYGTIPYGSQESVSYTLSDYVDKNGTYVIFTGTDEENPYYTVSDEYSKFISNRKTMWVSYMIDKFTECYEYSHTTIDVMDKDVELTLYECKLPSEYAQKILGVGSVGLYDAIVANTEDDGIKNLCQYYSDNSAYTLACSDANMLIGIDSAGYLRYVGLEVGGLGTSLYYTSVIVEMNNTEVRDEIDTTTAKNFETLYKDLADYCSQYTSVEEAMQSMGEDSDTSDIDPTDTEEENTTDSDTVNN